MAIARHPARLLSNGGGGGTAWDRASIDWPATTAGTPPGLPGALRRGHRFERIDWLAVVAFRDLPGVAWKPAARRG